MFFQNPFAEEYRGAMPLADRQYSIDFICPPNYGREREAVWAWSDGPYDFSPGLLDTTGSAQKLLTLAFSFDSKSWSTVSIDINAALTAKSIAVTNVTPSSLVTALNADATFKSYFTADCGTQTQNTINPDVLGGTYSYGTGRLKIKQNRPYSQFKFYVVNGGAEELLKFNYKAGVAELPEYFMRHTTIKANSFVDSIGMLVPLTLPIYSMTGGVPGIQANSGVSTAIVVTTIVPVVSQIPNAVDLTDYNVKIINSTCTPDIDSLAPNATTWVIRSYQDNFATNIYNFSIKAGQSQPHVTVGSNHGYWATVANVNVIANARDKNGNLLNYNFYNIQEDYQLLVGRAGIFNFKSIVIDPTGTSPNGTGRPLSVLEYPAGAGVGYLAKKTVYTYAAVGDATPQTVAEVPYILKQVDLITPVI